MMKFKSIACPEPYRGQDGFEPSIVVPDQALSLQEILERFTRGEGVPIGRDFNFHESDDDLEKVSHMDLVDREEFIDRLKATQADFEKQEKRKAAAEKKRLEAAAIEKLAAEKAAKEGAKPDPAK